MHEKWVPLRRANSAVEIPVGELLVRVEPVRLPVTGTPPQVGATRGAVSVSGSESADAPRPLLTRIFRWQGLESPFLGGGGHTRQRSGSEPAPIPNLSSQPQQAMLAAKPTADPPKAPETPVEATSPLPNIASFRRRRKERDSHRRSGKKDPGRFDRGLIDAFFVIGCGDMITDLEEHVAKQISEHMPVNTDPFTVSFSGELLDSFPWLDWEELSPSIWLFCLPEGISLLKNTKPDPTIFPFVLTASRGNRCAFIYTHILHSFPPLSRL